MLSNIAITSELPLALKEAFNEIKVSLTLMLPGVPSRPQLPLHLRINASVGFNLAPNRQRHQTLTYPGPELETGSRDDGHWISALALAAQRSRALSHRVDCARWALEPLSHLASLQNSRGLRGLFKALRMFA